MAVFRLMLVAFCCGAFFGVPVAHSQSCDTLCREVPNAYDFSTNSVIYSVPEECDVCTKGNCKTGFVLGISCSIQNRPVWTQLFDGGPVCPPGVGGKRVEGVRWGSPLATQKYNQSYVCD